jgi:hypothetical protein
MPHRRRRLIPSPALIVASLALLAALGGTAVAATTLARNSVGEVHLKTGAVTSGKVRDGSLRAVDFAPPARDALRGPAGPVGAAGTDGVSGIVVVGAVSTFDSAKEKTVVARCPDGKRLVGGGGGAWGRAMIWTPDGLVLTASHPLEDGAWLAAARELVPTNESWFLRANAICAAVR